MKEKEKNATIFYFTQIPHTVISILDIILASTETSLDPWHFPTSSEKNVKTSFPGIFSDAEVPRILFKLHCWFLEENLNI